jgi:hypothetical protein
MAAYEGVKYILSRTFSISFVETRWKETCEYIYIYIGNKQIEKKKKKKNRKTNKTESI